MDDRKSYGQFCALARALDRIGDRWTLLIVRELLLGPARYGELHRALPALATNLLALRLRQLETDGLIRRADHPAHRSYAIYELTDHGRALEPIVLEMIRWGGRYMASGPGTDIVDDRWALLALRVLLQTPHVTTPRGNLLVRCGDHELTVTIGPHGRQVLHPPSTATPPGHHHRPPTRTPRNARLRRALHRHIRPGRRTFSLAGTAHPYRAPQRCVGTIIAAASDPAMPTAALGTDGHQQLKG